MWIVSRKFRKVPNITLFNLYWIISGPMSKFCRTSGVAFRDVHTWGNMASLKTKIHVDTEPRVPKKCAKVFKANNQDTRDFIFISLFPFLVLNLSAPTPQNGQTHLNNSSATAVCSNRPANV